MAERPEDVSPSTEGDGRAPGQSEDEGSVDVPGSLARVASFDLDSAARPGAHPASSRPPPAVGGGGGDEAANTATGGSGDGDGDGSGGRSGRRRFDPDTAAQHHYLGDVEELGGSGRLLEEGATYTLPLFALEGVVLLPGASLPLILHSRPDLLKVERALRAPPEEPTARLVAVTQVIRGLHSVCLVGCTAEVRRMRRQQQEHEPDNTATGAAAAAAAAGGPGHSEVVALVVRGRQRLLLDASTLTDTFRVRCRVLAEGTAEAPPRQMSSGAAFWPAWAARPFDAPALAALAQRQCSAVLPQVSCHLGHGNAARRNPAAVRHYSYWLATNLPLHDEQRQQLLECRDTAGRLRLLLGWLSRLGALACKECGAQVSHCSSALVMSSEGAGSAFVNAHGYVHDIATFKGVQGLAYVGRPETAHSWFPGFAWTIAVCRNCGEHLGWRFTATSSDLQPEVFWGLRRTAIICPDMYGGSGRRQPAPELRPAAGPRRRVVYASSSSDGGSDGGYEEEYDDDEDYHEVYDDDDGRGDENGEGSEEGTASEDAS